MSKIVPTVIVSGFAGIGKTTLAKQFPNLFRDLESSDFHWIIDESGEKVVNPKWPANYIEAIKNLSNSGMYQAVFVSSHELVRKEMAKAKIRYTNIYPVDTPEMKRVLMERYNRRKSPEEFITNMDEHFSDYIKSMAEDKGATGKLQLVPDALTQWGTWCAYA